MVTEAKERARSSGSEIVLADIQTTENEPTKEIVSRQPLTREVPGGYRAPITIKPGQLWKRFSSETCIDCLRDRDYCPDCFDGSLYKNPDQLGFKEGR